MDFPNFRKSFTSRELAAYVREDFNVDEDVESRLIDEEIDGLALLELTESDLRELGINKMGNLRKIMRLIRQHDIEPQGAHQLPIEQSKSPVKRLPTIQSLVQSTPHVQAVEPYETPVSVNSQTYGSGVAKKRGIRSPSDTQTTKKLQRQSVNRPCIEHNTENNLSESPHKVHQVEQSSDRHGQAFTAKRSTDMLSTYKPKKINSILPKKGKAKVGRNLKRRKIEGLLPPSESQTDSDASTSAEPSMKRGRGRPRKSQSEKKSPWVTAQKSRKRTPQNPPVSPSSNASGTNAQNGEMNPDAPEVKTEFNEDMMDDFSLFFTDHSQEMDDGINSGDYPQDTIPEQNQRSSIVVKGMKNLTARKKHLDAVIQNQMMNEPILVDVTSAGQPEVGGEEEELFQVSEDVTFKNLNISKEILRLPQGEELIDILYSEGRGNAQCHRVFMRLVISIMSQLAQRMGYRKYYPPYFVKVIMAKKIVNEFPVLGANIPGKLDHVLYFDAEERRGLIETQLLTLRRYYKVTWKK